MKPDPHLRSKLKKQAKDINITIDGFDVVSEYAHTIKTLCDEYQLNQDDLLVFPYIDTLDEDDYESAHKNIKQIKKIPVFLTIPQKLTPKLGQSRLRLQKTAAPERNDSEGPTPRDNRGITEFELRSPYTYNGVTKKIRYWQWVGFRDYYPLGNWCYFIEKKDYFEFAKAIFRLQRKTIEVETPILRPDVLRDIYDNSIGFLKRGAENQQQYKDHRIAYKRGILLAGNPGCGKTLTCKWLRQLCIKNQFSYKIVTMDSYRRARERGNLRSLFKPPEGNKGIVFFDDMDQAVKSRESGNVEVVHFLTALDGIDPTEGVVYVFTTNYMKELDEAFVRPGRIDVFIPFKKPSAKLRRIFVEKMFSKDLQDLIDIEEFVKKTNEYTFADMEEIRKLLCLDLIDNKTPSIDKTFEIFNNHRKEFEERANFGFNSLGDDDDDDDDIMLWDSDDFPDDFS